MSKYSYLFRPDNSSMGGKQTYNLKNIYIKIINI
jgi:hypothetical protein